MLGTRVTSFAFGFACASAISMYKIKEDIWSSHKILADQVRATSRTRDPTRRADVSPTSDLTLAPYSSPHTDIPPPASSSHPKCASTEARLSKLEMTVSKQ